MLENAADKLGGHLVGGLGPIVEGRNHGEDGSSGVGRETHVANVDLVERRLADAEHELALFFEADIGGALDELIGEAIGNFGEGSHAARDDEHGIGGVGTAGDRGANVVVVEDFDLGRRRTEQLLNEVVASGEAELFGDHAEAAVGGDKVSLFNTLVGLNAAECLAQEDRSTGSGGGNCEDQGCRNLRPRILSCGAAPRKFMATTSTLRLRRNAAQLHALAEVERTIRATDPNGRRKYLREFTEAFQSYHSVINGAQVREQLAASDVVLVGDYHALASSQLYCEKVVTQLVAEGRQVVLGLETVFARDQHLLDEWSSREIDGAELRERLRFDIDWGYDWFPFYRLLETARANCERIYGLDCGPRNDLRKIARRDQHAAARIRRIRKENPHAVIVVLFGESHLAPGHLPEELKKLLPERKMTTVLQNVDALYWKAGGERRDRVEAVRVSDEVICVFNASPLEKYESYRMYLERWAREPRESLDLAPTVLNLIDALLQFLNIDKYIATAGSSGLCLVDVYPEVCYRQTEAAIAKLVLRKRGANELRAVLARLNEQGCCYVPRLNTFFLRHFELLHLTEEIAWYVHRACRGEIGKVPASTSDRTPQEAFYQRALEQALRFFGSRVLFPSRPVLRETELYGLYLAPESNGDFPREEFEKMLDFLVMHKDYEAHRGKYFRMPLLIEQGLLSNGMKLEYLTKQLGQLLGNEIYEGYLAGQVGKRTIRALYFADLHASGAAEAAYFDIARKCARRPRKQAS